MALNKVIMNGRIPNFEATYYPQDGNKAAFLSMSISVKRNFKKQDEQYYPEDLIRIKAFGSTATLINDYFKPGAGINIEGSLQRDDKYTDEATGEEKGGGLFVMVEKVYFPEGNAKEGTSNGTSNAKSNTANRGAAGNKPAGRASVPGGNRTTPGGGARVPGGAPGRASVPGGARRTQGGPPTINR